LDHWHEREQKQLNHTNKQNMNEEEFNHILEQFRDDEPLRLSFEPALEKLLDNNHCQSISRLLRDGGTWERLVATPQLSSELPEERGLYMFVWRPQIYFQFEDPKPEQPFWIGCGSSGARQKQHETLPLGLT
jgi:hypothetical protein